MKIKPGKLGARYRVCIGLQIGQRVSLPSLHCVGGRSSRFRPGDVSALSEARFRERVQVGGALRRAFDTAV